MFRALRFILIAVAAAGYSFASDTLPFSETSADDLRSLIAETGDRFLILTPSVLYRFSPEAESWTITTDSDGLPGNNLRSLSLTDDQIWVSGDGVSVSDIRFDDWQCYGPGEGCPGSLCCEVDSDQDYAYAGTDAGAARYDRYILEWETLDGPDGTPLGPVSCVVVGEERVWFAMEGAVSEYRKETESFRVDVDPGGLGSSAILALRQTVRFVWAVTDRGLARYDKELRTWTGFRAGVDLPDARVHRIRLRGDDVWLGTDDGLWWYSAENGIWRRHESFDEMPGKRVLAFSLETDRIWVATESAFAVYEEETARWIDFTSSVPLLPVETLEMKRSTGTLLLLGSSDIVYGLDKGQENPSLFTFRNQEVLRPRNRADGRVKSGPVRLDDAGLGIRLSPDANLHIKGGATVYIENDNAGSDSGLGDIQNESRLDLVLNGRFSGERTLSGFYDDMTDPDNPAYQLTYRGARSDHLRVVSAGEIEQQLFNSRLAPGTGLLGGRFRMEFGKRSEETRRRLVTVDGWAGERRTLPGRDVFIGGNLSVSNSIRDIDYIRSAVFPAPDGWSADNLIHASLYLDDNNAATDDANTIVSTMAGISGSWDLLKPNTDYLLGPGGNRLILAAPLGEDHLLALAGGPGEIEISGSHLRNHYWITNDPVPGSLVVTITDSTGSGLAPSGTSYMEIFGLDSNGDGMLDAERFSPITGLLSFPDLLPFPEEAYDEENPLSFYSIGYGYQAALNTFSLSHGDLIPKSEIITVDRERLRSGVDYDIIPASGLFIFYEHVLLDDDSVIEVEYVYEVNAADGGDQGIVYSGQIGIAPSDHLFCGANATSWRNENEEDVLTTDLNARFEWKEENRFLRVTPEAAFSRTRPGGASSSNEREGKASSIGLQGRYRGLELSASHRNLGEDFSSFEDRRTLLGRLREETVVNGRVNIGRHMQAEMEWDKSLSDQVDRSDDSTAESTTSRGEESSLIGALRYLHSGLPNLTIKRGRILHDAAGERREKWITRAELEISPEQAGRSLPGIDRLWLRAFFQRTDRERNSQATAGSDSTTTPARIEKTTDHAFVRLNGSIGSPLTWNLALEDRHTHSKESEGNSDLRRFQKVDATLHSQPHSSVDAFVSWKSDRDLFYHPEGDGGGFNVNRILMATVQVYPGRLADRLSPLSLRFDLADNDRENGEPGIRLPGRSSLWSPVSDLSRRHRTRNGVMEARIQALSWLRIIERWETDSDRITHEELGIESKGRRLENRVEINPRGGLLTLRGIGYDTEEGTADRHERRFSGQWDQTWGNGILTFCSLDAKRIETSDRKKGDITWQWNPQAQVTWRRSRWHMDATLGGALSWTRTRDRSPGESGTWSEERRQTLSASLNMHPASIFTLKVEYGLHRLMDEINSAPDSNAAWKTSHDLRIRLQIQA